MSIAFQRSIGDSVGENSNALQNWPKGIKYHKIKWTHTQSSQLSKIIYASNAININTVSWHMK